MVGLRSYLPAIDFDPGGQRRNVPHEKDFQNSDHLPMKEPNILDELF